MNTPATGPLTDEEALYVNYLRCDGRRRASIEVADPALFARMNATRGAVGPAQDHAHGAFKALRTAIERNADSEDIAHLTAEYRAACDASETAWFAWMDAFEESWTRGST